MEKCKGEFRLINLKNKIALSTGITLTVNEPPQLLNINK